MKEKVDIEKVYSRKKNGVVPMLMKFQNGKLSAFTKENTQFTRLRSSEDKNKLVALLMANGSSYCGVINNTESSELTDTYVCVQNKKTNKMSVIPIDQVNLKNSIYNKLDHIKKSDLSDNVTKMTLLKKFGGRNASRYINDQEQLRMDITVVEDDLNATVNESSLLEAEEESKADNSKYFDSIRPTYNADAKNLSDIYQITDVIPADLLERLEDEAKTIYQTQMDQIPLTSDYLKKILAEIQQSVASAENFQRLKLIIYMDSLLNLIKSRVRSLKKVELSKISEKVENNVRDRFADPNSSVSGSRTLFSTEKALCHFIVMSLLVDNSCQADATLLSQELNAPRAKILKYARIVFAFPKSKTSTLVFKLPKNAPALSTSFTKKK